MGLFVAAERSTWRNRTAEFAMKKIINSIAILTIAFTLVGCAGQTEHTKRGAVGGAAAGAILGGIIGHQSGRGLEGAAVGAGAGALGGGVLGSAADERAR